MDLYIKTGSDIEKTINNVELPYIKKIIYSKPEIFTNSYNNKLNLKEKYTKISIPLNTYYIYFLFVNNDKINIYYYFNLEDIFEKTKEFINNKKLIDEYLDKFKLDKKITINNNNISYYEVPIYKKWFVYQYHIGCDEELIKNFDTLKEVVDYDIKDYNITTKICKNNDFPKLEDIEKDLPQMDIGDWMKAPKYCFFKIPNEDKIKDIKKLILISKIDDTIRYVSQIMLHINYC